MRRMLMITVASFAVASAALAQQPTPVPATPPVATQDFTPDVTADKTMGAVQTPSARGSGEASAPTTVAPDPAHTAATNAVDAVAPAPAETGAALSAQARTAPAPTADAAVQAQASPAPDAAAAVAAQAQPAPDAAAPATSAALAPASASGVCQPRTTSLAMGARTSGLSLENRNSIEYAVDAASVCQLQQVVIVDSADGRVSARRTAAVREALIRQGVPENAISVQEAVDASGEGLDVRMQFAGVAQASPSAQATPSAPAPG